MPEDLSGAESSFSSAPSARACDRCRKRKMRCDRSSPCSGCRSAGTECKASKRAARQRQTRVLISSKYEEKIDLIDDRLDRVIRLVESLNANPAMAPSLGHPSSSPLLSSSETRSSHQALESLTAGEGSQSFNDQIEPSANSAADDEMAVEGQSFLTSQSTFAINFVHKVVGSSQEMGDSYEISELLDQLRHIGQALNHRRSSPKPMFPLAQVGSSVDRNSDETLPLKAAFHVLQKAQGYSDAEFIIVNAILNFLVSDKNIEQNCPDAHEHSRLVLICRKNLEIALSRLSLYTKASYDMVLALVLGAMYAINNSNPSLAWTLVIAASQCSHSLGFHTRLNYPDVSSNEQNQKRFLFCAVYFLEKSLCLRLGRSSTIPDCDISFSWAESQQLSNSHAIGYASQLVKITGLSGRIYEQLYSTNALHLPGETRAHRALELSQELHGYCVEARDTNQFWMQSAIDDHDREQIRFIFASDEVMRLSMLTLIYRAMPPQRASGTTFSKECIASARCALESHQAFIQDLGTKDSLLLSVYVKWTILFTPFIPFIVIFCHAIETGDSGDLRRMHAFVKSVECTCQHSNAISKHHRLFQVFHGVAVRYNELKSSPSLFQGEQVQLRTEVDAHLSALGLQPQPGIGHRGQETDHMASSIMPSVGIAENQDSEESDWGQQGLWLGNWLSFNQQMMGLLDHNDLPF